MRQDFAVSDVLIEPCFSLINSILQLENLFGVKAWE